MKAAIYCRVSTDDQQKEGTSLQSQKDGCLKKAFELGYEVPDEFIVLETFSGLALDRPKLSELRQWVKDKDVDIVIAYTLDRLTRDPGHFIILQEEINRAGVVLDLVTETIESSDLGKLVVYIKGFAAKLEAEKIRERTTRGRKSRAQMGKLPTGGVNLYGYDYDSTTGKRKVNDYQASVVAMMFRWLIEE
ncbi:MAG: recombinase family protein [Dehalococcoidia bacterium]